MSLTLVEIAGLREFWERGTGRAPPARRMAVADRVMLDALGLGLEQAFRRMQRASDEEFDSFLDWIDTTAGPPDPIAIARYHAWRDGAEPPPAVRERIAAIEAMPPVLDAADLAHWEREGYVVLGEAVTADEAAAAAALLWRTIGADPADPASWYALDTQGIMVQHFQGAALDALRRSPRVHKAYAQLWGTADLWTRIDRLSFNPPAGPRSPSLGPRLHWDASLTPPIPFATQGVLYLTDTSPDQGALELVPGIQNRIGPWLASLGGADPRGVDLSGEAVTVGGNAGDLVIWHQGLPHGPSPNLTPRPRLVHYLTMYAPHQDDRDWL